MPPPRRSLPPARVLQLRPGPIATVLAPGPRRSSTAHVGEPRLSSAPGQRPSSRRQGQVLRNSHFCLHAPAVSRATNGVTAVPWTDRLACSSSRPWLSTIQILMTAVCRPLLFQGKMTLLRSVASSADGATLQHAGGGVRPWPPPHSAERCTRGPSCNRPTTPRFVEDILRSDRRARGGAHRDRLPAATALL